MPKISWNGRLYTKKDFLEMMHREFAEAVYYRRRGDKIIPPGKIKKDDLESWMVISGAHFV